MYIYEGNHRALVINTVNWFYYLSYVVYCSYLKWLLFPLSMERHMVKPPHDVPIIWSDIHVTFGNFHVPSVHTYNIKFFLM